MWGTIVSAVVTWLTSVSDRDVMLLRRLLLTALQSSATLRVSPGAGAASRVATAAAVSSRRSFALGAAAALLTPAAARAEEKPADCAGDCFRECDKVAPGNAQYCREQCGSYCASLGTAEGVAASKAAAAESGGGKQLNNGIFGLGVGADQGVSYSAGVEDLLASAFGATRQAKPVSEADVGAYASEVGAAASKLLAQ